MKIAIFVLGCFLCVGLLIAVGWKDAPQRYQQNAAMADCKQAVEDSALGSERRQIRALCDAAEAKFKETK